MNDSLVDRTVVESLIAKLLIDGPDMVEPAIRVLYPTDPVPDPSPDDGVGGSDTPIDQWCRLNSAVMVPDAKRNESGDQDQQGFVMSITVGASDAQILATPTRIGYNQHLIVAALSGAHSEHAATSHHIQINSAKEDEQAAGTHAATRNGVIMLSGIATRVSGRAASLTL